MSILFDQVFLTWSNTVRGRSNPGSESSGVLTPRSDMALLKLDKSPILDKSVGLACLPGAGEVLSHGAACYLSGWGNLYSKTLLPVS